MADRAFIEVQRGIIEAFHNFFFREIKPDTDCFQGIGRHFNMVDEDYNDQDEEIDEDDYLTFMDEEDDFEYDEEDEDFPFDGEE